MMKPYFQAATEAIRVVLDFESTATLREETELEADLGMDSGLMMELLMQLEDVVPGLVIDQATISYEEFRSVGTVCDYIAARVKPGIPA